MACNKDIDTNGWKCIAVTGAGRGQKKQEEAMSLTFVNFSQVETETATTPQLNTFGFKRIHCDIIWQKLSVF